jgi:hypothetical protein
MSVDASFETQVMACARLFRLGRDIEGGMCLAEVCDGLVKILESSSPAITEQAPRVLSALFSAQQRQDWLGLADTLDVELLQMLKHPED